MSGAELIYSTLHGDATLVALLGGDADDDHIYPAWIPTPTSVPCISYRQLSGVASPSAPADEVVYAVDIWVKNREISGFAAMEAIYERVDSLLSQRTLRGTGGVAHVCIREGAIDLIETETALLHKSLRYRLKIQG